MYVLQYVTCFRGLRRISIATHKNVRTQSYRDELCPNVFSLEPSGGQHLVKPTVSLETSFEWRLGQANLGDFSCVFT
jgi:hypothetical protein